MDTRLPFNDWLAKVQITLFKYLDDHDMYSHAMVGAKWKPEAGDSHANRVVAQGVLTGGRGLDENSRHRGQL